MAANRYTGLNKMTNGWNNILSTFNLNGVAATLLHNPNAIANTILFAYLVAAKRHVAYY